MTLFLYFTFFRQEVNVYYTLLKGLSGQRKLLYILVLIHVKYVHFLFVAAPEILLNLKNHKISQNNVENFPGRAHSLFRL